MIATGGVVEFALSDLPAATAGAEKSLIQDQCLANFLDRKHGDSAAFKASFQNLNLPREIHRRGRLQVKRYRYRDLPGEKDIPCESWVDAMQFLEICCVERCCCCLQELDDFWNIQGLIRTFQCIHNRAQALAIVEEQREERQCVHLSSDGFVGFLGIGGMDSNADRSESCRKGSSCSRPPDYGRIGQKPSSTNGKNTGEERSVEQDQPPRDPGRPLDVPLLQRFPATRVHKRRPSRHVWFSGQNVTEALSVAQLRL